MITYNELNTLEMLESTACGLGNFDGVHLGHQKLIRELVKQAQIKNLDSIIITFEPHPSKLLTPEKATPLLMTLKQKKDAIKAFGVNHLILAPFTAEFAQLDYKEFIHDILIKKCKARLIVVGFDYRFGYKGKGTPELLRDICQNYGIETIIIPPVTYKGKIVSSSFIRSLIKNGDVKTASEYMGRFFSIKGKVIHGNSIGNKLGFPTANISYSPNIVLPVFGVYAVILKWNKSIFKGIANIGKRPTFNGSEVTLEVHIFDFNKRVYGEVMEVFFVQNIRKEIKFNNPLELTRQIKIDCIKANNILNKFTI